MGGTKVEKSFPLNEDHVEWLQRMAEEYGLMDEGKALRVVLDYVMHEADPEAVFSEIRCHHCG